MNFEFKSTFKKSKTTLISSVKASGLIWITTSSLASFYHWIIQTTGHSIDKIMLVSLLGSLPAALLLVPNFYVIKSCVNERFRLLAGCISIFCIGVLMTLFIKSSVHGVPIDEFTFSLIILPYFIAAQISFLVFARNAVSKTSTNKLNRIY